MYWSNRSKVQAGSSPAPILLAAAIIFTFFMITGTTLAAPSTKNSRLETADPGEIILTEGTKLIIPAPLTEASPLSTVVEHALLPSDAKRIALTFDTGCLRERRPGYALNLGLICEPAMAVLDVLDRYNVTATFFPQATWLEDYPEVGREIVKRGHSIGNHTLTHIYFAEIEYDEAVHEVRESTRILERVTGFRPYIFRPSFGYYNDFNRQLFAREGYPYTLMWTVITQDSYRFGIWGQLVTPNYIAERALTYADDGGIILMHSLPQTAEALPMIITGLRDEGYEFATIYEMLPPPPQDLGQTVYYARGGETLASVAGFYGISVDEILEVNIPQISCGALLDSKILWKP